MPTLTHSTQENLLLSMDNVDEWRALPFANSERLTAWFEEHTLHAMECCPNAVALWLEETGSTRARQLHLVSCALSALSDAEKIAVIEGRCQNKAQKFVAHYLQKNSDNFDLLSPAWLGAPTSLLRRVALEKGWHPRFLLKQIPWCLGRQDAEQWASWIAYPHSIFMLEEFAWDQEIDGGMINEARTSKHWATGVDVALGQCLLKHLPWKSAVGTFVAHPQVEPVSQEVSERIEAMVLAYVGLGMTDELQACILDGSALDAQPQMELSNLHL